MKIKRKDVKINFGGKPLMPTDWGKFFAKAKNKHIKRYYEIRFKNTNEIYKLTARKFIDFKQKAKERAQVNERVTNGYSLENWGYIYDYLSLHPRGKNLVREWNDRNDKKGRINALTCNLLATGGGFFLIQQLWRERWRKGYFFSKRINYFFCGWTEEGYLFAHPITGQAVARALETENWWEYLLNYIWGGKLNKLTYRQGEWGLIQVKKVPDVYVETDISERDNHIFENMLIFSDGKRMYALALEDAKLIHKTGRHKDVNVEEGVYEIITTKEADAWDFGRRVD